MKRILISLLLFSMITGCEEEEVIGARKESEQPKVLELGKKTDESLQEFIKRKYIRLELSCSLKYTGSKIQEDGSKVTTEPKLYELIYWDILSDYSLLKTQEVELQIDNMKMEVQLVLKSGFINSLSHTVLSEADAVEYQLKEAFLLNGSYKSEAVWVADDGGSISKSTDKNDINLYDRIPLNLESYTLSGVADIKSASIDCLIGAETKPGFESHFKATKN